MEDGFDEKVEGFFKTCQVKGITGSQGVIIPKGNVPQLMLDDNVIQAVTNGKFHILLITTVDEGLELLTGQDPGELKDDGTYPEGSINHAAATRLVEFVDAIRAISAGAEERLKDGEEGD